MPQCCPLCKGPEDGLFHRLWQCPATRQLRDKLIPKELMSKIPAEEEQLSPDMRALLLHCLPRHPVQLLARPCQGDGCQLYVDGKLVDGGRHMAA